jgi:hypothetical protein
MEFTDTALWQRSLGQEDLTDGARTAVERLRASYLLAREKAGLLAAEIATHHQDLTVHDGSHLDALWEMGSLVAGPDYRLNAAEGYVFGIAVLIHDLGLAAAALPDGEDGIRSHPLWSAAITRALKRELGHQPTEEELARAPHELELHATRFVLRQLHAERASAIATSAFTGAGNRHFLIDDEDLRSGYGEIAGRIAHSHWWPVTALPDEFSSVLGRRPWAPDDWTVSPLRTACLLRAADASHLDVRRAPPFLRALRQPREESDPHWAFQARLAVPSLANNKLEYAAGEPFPPEDAGAWWLCKRALEVVHRELSDIDDLLSGQGQPRFAARGVAAVHDPKRLSQAIRVSGWIPVDTRIRVDNVGRLAQRLGGEALYGSGVSAPIRELIQNGLDAVRARRILDDADDDWGAVQIELRDGPDGELHVSDNGIGMPADVLTGDLLSFGSSHWDSDSILFEHPELLSKGFEPTGQYGIGFFSVFVLTQQVTVLSKEYRAARADTMALEFREGTDGPPLLRRAANEEQIADGGTSVTVSLDRSLRDTYEGRQEFPEGSSLSDFAAWLAPASPVTLSTVEESRTTTPVAAYDWLTLPADAMLRRLTDLGRRDGINDDRLQAVAANVRLIVDADGKTIGRAALLPLSVELADHWLSSGVVTVGGLRASVISGLTGLLSGESTVAARDLARPIADREALRDWANEQAALVRDLVGDEHSLAQAAAAVAECWGDPGDLPAFASTDGYLSRSDVLEWARTLDEIQVGTAPTDLLDAPTRPRDAGTLMSISSRLGSAKMDWPTPPPPPGHLVGTLLKPIEILAIEQIAKAWGVTPEALLPTTEDNDIRPWLGQGYDDRGSWSLSVVLRRP